MRLFARIVLSIVVSISLVASASAQAADVEKGRIKLDTIDRLAAKARKSIEVDMDATLIKVATLVLSDDDSGERAIKDLALSLRGVYVRKLQFDSAGQYDESDLAEIRRQLSAPGWSKIVDVSGGRLALEIEDAEIYVSTTNGMADGIVVLAAQPRSVTVANIVGSLDLEKLRKIGGSLGIPRIRIRRRN